MTAGRPAIARSRVAALLLVAASACSKQSSVGGLVVELHTDGTLAPAPDSLTIQVGSIDGGVPYREGTFPMTEAATAGQGTYTWPVSFAVDSNGDPQASVGFSASAESTANNVDLETQAYEVHSIPTGSVVQLDVVFSAACAATVSDGATTGGCCTPPCTWSGTACVCDARMLPLAPSGAALPHFTLPEAGTPEGGPPDLGPADSAPSDGEAPDATLSDARAPDAASPDMGAPDGAEAGPQPGSACDAGDVQCLTFLTPEQCGQDGQWHTLPGCLGGATYCFTGTCIPAPTSCVESNNDYYHCESDLVGGGSYLRGNDPLHADAGAPATISTFRLDAWEVTSGRFAAFVAAVQAGKGVPASNAGRHTYLPGDALNGGGTGTNYESGWDSTWDDSLFTSNTGAWPADLTCSQAATLASYSGDATLPINCTTWYEAYAFCIWDGGFLPTEAEWNYAAADGSDQRLYPWGSADPSIGGYANYGCMGFACTDPTLQDIWDNGGEGYGQSAFGGWNLAGNLAEWTLDWYAAAYPTPCNDCTSLVQPAPSQRMVRGGSFDQGESFLYTSTRVPTDPTTRSPDLGIRCARAP